MDKIKKGHAGGQATVEYVLLLAVVIMMFTMFMRYFEDGDAYARITKPLTVDFKNAYQYGNPGKGSQKYIAQDPENFRIFLNPPTKK